MVPRCDAITAIRRTKKWDTGVVSRSVRHIKGTLYTSDNRLGICIDGVKYNYGRGAPDYGGQYDKVVHEPVVGSRYSCDKLGDHKEREVGELTEITKSGDKDSGEEIVTKYSVKFEDGTVNSYTADEVCELTPVLPEDQNGRRWRLEEESWKTRAEAEKWKVGDKVEVTEGGSKSLRWNEVASVRGGLRGEVKEISDDGNVKAEFVILKRSKAGESVSSKLMVDVSTNDCYKYVKVKPDDSKTTDAVEDQKTDDLPKSICIDGARRGAYN